MGKIRKTIKNMAKNNKQVYLFLKNINKNIRGIKLKLSSRIDNVEDKHILFSSYMGNSFSCSPKNIYLEMLKDERFKDYKFTWAFKRAVDYSEIDALDRCNIVIYNSSKFFKELSKSKIWVVNSRLPEITVKRKNQFYVQCWHGTPLKRLGNDIEVEGANALHKKKKLMKIYENDAAKYDLMFSPSKYYTDKITSAFNLEKLSKSHIVMETGYPRNDMLCNYTAADVERIKNNLGLSPDKKVILYAPTWRDDQHEIGIGYTLKLGIDFEKLMKDLSDEYVIIFRAHYFIRNQFDFDKYKGFVIDGGSIHDINDLYIISDLLITDYSSVFFDYAMLERPIIFYMYDLEYYRNEVRGFYLSLDELPGEIITEQQPLTKLIKNPNPEYMEKIKSFNEIYNYLEDGKSSKRAVDEIYKLLSSKE
jgi:CDP-glycerol glycerophosphotransferase